MSKYIERSINQYSFPLLQATHFPNELYLAMNLVILPAGRTLYLLDL